MSPPAVHSTVLDGAVVESEAMVAAGAVVTPGKIVRRGELWAGNPARKLRDLTEKDFETFKRFAAGYVTLSRSYLTDETAKAAD
jgi:carbonic anhydrase/acetyltransferase-like protein (isoleucine patch superfamily)